VVDFSLVRAAAVLTGLALAACGPTHPGGAGASRTDAILAATDDTTTATVFLLDLRFDNGDASICSAVQVSPRVLLTAAHCIEPALHSGATRVTVKATNKANDSMLMASDFIEVTVQARHPQWDASASRSPYDLGALLLASAPVGTTPAPLQRTLPANLVGQPIRIVGYGRASAGAASSSGTRRTAYVTVDGVTSGTLDFGAAGTAGICSGDSGGPSFFRGPDSVERVIGIHSLTRSSSCGLGSDIRVDARLAFIDGFIAANDPPLCTGDGRCASGCTPRDPDCACTTDGMCESSCPAGVTDPDCGCVSNGSCEAGCPAGTDPDCRCRADGACEGNCPGGGTDPDCTCDADAVCVAACPVSQPDPDCAECGADGTCSATSCPKRDPDCLDDGAGCVAAAECVGKQCIEDPRGFTFCSRACASSADCQLDMVCTDGLCRAAESRREAVRGGCAAVPAAEVLAFGLLAGCARRRRRLGPRDLAPRAV
jgi:V8-like Glu-specific endopeptidase